MKRMRILFVVGGLVAAGGMQAARAGNLVPNPSFETVSQCPDDIDLNTGQIDYAPPWQRAGSTPDLMHACGLIPAVEVPNNQMGSQCGYGLICTGTPYPGAYAGIACYFASAADMREYIQVPLTHSLLPGVKYRIRFWASLADYSNYAIDRIGAAVSTGAVVPGSGVLPLTAQVESPAGTPIADMTNWVKVEGTFFAGGGEDHLVLGVFRTDAELTIQNPGGQVFDHAYYYIDAVWLATADITDIAPALPGPGGDPSVVLTGGTPNSPAFLYCGTNLDGSEIGGHPFDLGDPVLLAQATTDAAGQAVFTWTGDPSCAGRAGGPVWLEARVEDPTDGESTDSGQLAWDATTDVGEGTAPSAPAVLEQNTPNPFNPRTQIAFRMERGGRASLQVLDLRGRVVTTLLAGEVAAGAHRVGWDGTDVHGRPMASGVYFYRLESAGQAWTRRMTLLK